MKKTLYTILFLTGFGILASAAFAVDQVKTTETYILSSDTAVSSTTPPASGTIPLYIGDNLAGVTAPAVKSLYFVVSGLFTGNAGSLTIDIDGDPATSKTYSLITTGNIQRPLEIIYIDPSNKINPTSAGSYTYTLNVSVAGGSVVSNLSVKMSETHRYTPPSCADGASSSQKTKTTETYVLSSDTAVSSTTPPASGTIPLYIGDNLGGVTAPAVKSLYFVVSFMDMGDTVGTITIDIDGDPATLKTFSVPAVAKPRPYQIIYIDPSNKINPTSAGSYTYTLNISVAGGSTIYGLGVKMVETHQYAPPSCGGMPILGDLISAVFDSTGSTDGGAYNSVMWTGSLGGPGLNEGKVRFQFAGADSPAGPWSYIGGATCGAGDWFDPGAPNVPIELIGTGVNASACRSAWNNKRYYRYKIEICSNDCTSAGTYTPTVNNVIVNWTP